MIAIAINARLCVDQERDSPVFGPNGAAEWGEIGQAIGGVEADRMGNSATPPPRSPGLALFLGTEGKMDMLNILF